MYFGRPLFDAQDTAGDQRHVANAEKPILRWHYLNSHLLGSLGIKRAVPGGFIPVLTLVISYLFPCICKGPHGRSQATMKILYVWYRTLPTVPDIIRAHHGETEGL